MPITINSKIAHGKPIISGTRISVEFILELLASGMTIEEILKEYSHLKKKNILEAVAYAKKSMKHEEIIPFSSQAA